MEVKCDRNNAPLHIAINCGHPDVVKYLVEHGADVEAEDVDGWTPLLLMRRRGYAEVGTYIKQNYFLLRQRFEKAKEIRSVDGGQVGQPVDHSLRRMLFGGNQLRRNAPLSPTVAARLKKRSDRS